jgi:hypothetical protein
MKQNHLYHWIDKKGFEFIKKYGIRGEEGWLHTLLNNETGGPKTKEEIKEMSENIIRSFKSTLSPKECFDIRHELYETLKNC